MRAGPHISAVERGEDGSVANDLDPELGGAAPNLRPLAEEKVLNETVGFGARLQLRLQRRLLRRGEGSKVIRPFPPRTPAEMILQRRKQRVSGKPWRIFPLE